MKKIAFLILVAAVAATPTVAAAKKAHKSKTITNEEALKIDKDKNAASWHFVKDALPLALPSWALPIYFGMHKEAKN